MTVQQLAALSDVTQYQSSASTTSTASAASAASTTASPASPASTASTASINFWREAPQVFLAFSPSNSRAAFSSRGFFRVTGHGISRKKTKTKQKRQNKKSNKRRKKRRKQDLICAQNPHSLSWFLLTSGSEFVSDGLGSGRRSGLGWTVISFSDCVVYYFVCLKRNISALKQIFFKKVDFCTQAT